MVLAQKHKDSSVKQERKPKNKPTTHMTPTKKESMLYNGERQFLQLMLLGKLDGYI